MHAGVRAMLASADSMAWSYAARKQGRNPNDWREAEKFAERVELAAGMAITPWQAPLFT